MKKTLVYPSLLLVTTAWIGCTFQPKEGAGAGTGAGSGNNGTGNSGAGATTGGYDANLDRNFTTQDVNMSGGDACPPSTFTANSLPPNLLILLDRSTSMRQDAAGMSCGGNPADCGPTSKWTLMVAAINSVVSASQAEVNWGLKFFGSGSGSCDVGNGAAVAPAPNTAAAIAAAITANPPGSSTPTTAGVTSAGNYMSMLTDANPKYILLATDGQPTCGSGGGQNSDGPAAIAAVTAVAARGIPVFVIGIAADTAAGTTLDSMAEAGGRPRAGTPKYYSVSSTADLSAALTAIKGMTALPCTFQLNGVPSNLTAVTVSVGGQVLPMSDWMYGMGNRSIVFPESGTICSQLKSGAIKDVVIQLPCGETIIP